MRLVVLHSPGGYGEMRRVASPNSIVYNSERMQCCEADKQPAQPTATRPSAAAADLEIASVARDSPDLQAHTAHRLAVPARVPQCLRSQSLDNEAEQLPVSPYNTSVFVRWVTAGIVGSAQP